MSRRMRLLLAAVVVLLGLVLIIGGIAVRTYGAVVIGIIVAGVAAQQFLAAWKKESGEHTREHGSSR